MMDKIKDRVIAPSISLLDAMKRMDEIKVKMLFVFHGVFFDGIITIGDIQRAIINNIPLNEPISIIIDKNKKYAKPNEDRQLVRSKMMSLRAECMPVVNDKGELVDVYFWDDFFKHSEQQHREKINLPVVIMAGGKGTRLKPLTNGYLFPPSCVYQEGNE